MEIEKQKRKRQVNPDRITLSKAALDVLAKIEGQIDKTFGGMLKLKNKELTNFLLEVRGDDLASSELKAIKARYFDEVRAATWALQKLKEAKERGEELKLSQILAQLQTPLVKEKSKPNMSGKKKSLVEPVPASSLGDGPSGGPATASHGAPKER